MAKKMPPFMGKETAKEEKAEKKMPPWLYKKGEKAEGVHGKEAKAKPFAKGGMVRRGYGKARGC